jgi:hypothetical protein
MIDKSGRAHWTNFPSLKNTEYVGRADCSGAVLFKQMI